MSSDVPAPDIPVPDAVPDRRPASAGRLGLATGHRDRMNRIQEFARVARTALDPAQLDAITERLLARLRTLHPVSSSYGRFRYCIVELNQPMADAIADELLGPARRHTDAELPRRAARRGLRRAVDTFTPGSGEGFRGYAASVIAAEAHRLTNGS
ncbi:hypothetical protein [Yinghuangia soli]|uniref:Uncharacterized protein n=1 Tax=Yinghuangia soli TaxID=2908204 RepID=A0AA41QAN3_9ACTN|nr:hypothetical protein [Yinghuangia soli]MCF2533439.1 hypothetical protein [Yinghuangia soli]